jgi:hypothetical protein
MIDATCRRPTVNLKKWAALVVFLFLLGAVGAQSQKAAPAPPADPPSTTPIPAVADTMSWISAHFEKSSQTLSIEVTTEPPDLTDDERQAWTANGGSVPTIDADLTIVTTHTYSVSFQECSVTLTQKAVNDATQKGLASQRDKRVGDATIYGRKNVGHDSTVVGPFELSNLSPNKILVAAADSAMKTGPRLKITAISAIPNAVTVDGQDLMEVLGLSDLHAQNKALDDRLALALTPSKSPDTVSEITIDFATPEMADRQAKAWKAAITGCGGKTVPDKLF